MDKEAKKYDLNDLYKTLKVRDLEILKNFNNTDISDNDYFFYGINSDIVSNALSVVINLLSCNKESAGVDASCRTIIEAMVILKMDANGDITDNQKKIYRYLYAYVDDSNFHYKANMPDELKEKAPMEEFYKDKEKAKQAIIAHFKCAQNDLRQNNIGIDDPCFYLKQNLNDNIRFAKLLEKYPIGNEKDLRLYEFFSLFIHPRCEMSLEMEESIMKVRDSYIANILDYVFEYLKNCNLLSYPSDTTDFDTDFYYNPLLRNNIVNISSVNYILDKTITDFCTMLDGKIDAFTWQFINRIKYLLIDMMTALSLGYKEHVLSTYKSFVEEYSVYFAINCIDDLTEFNYIKQGFWVSSRIQLESHLGNMGIKTKVMSEDKLSELYNQFYKDKYKLKKEKDFYWDMRNNSLYFLSKEKKSYNKFVKALFHEVFKINEAKEKDAMSIYKMAKDTSHASGYNFNATEDVMALSCHKAMLYTWELLMYYVLNADLTLQEHGIDRDVQTSLGVFKDMSQMQVQAIDSILKEHYGYNPRKD